MDTLVTLQGKWKFFIPCIDGGKDSPLRHSLNSGGRLRIIQHMRKITRKSISVLLVVALLLAGIQSVRIADMVGSGVVAAEMTADMPVMDHDCSDCDSQDCCADMNCQMTSHCLAYPAMLAGSDLSVFDGPAGPALRLVSPSLPSRLIPTIYRPPWA